MKFLGESRRKKMVVVGEGEREMEVSVCVFCVNERKQSGREGA